MKAVKASDVMSTRLVTVPVDMPARSVAVVLLENGISAVPVIDDNGIPLGIVSEGDLMPRDDSARDARRDWWLEMLSQGESLGADFVRLLESADRTAGDIMVSPLVSVGENAPLSAVAELLSERRIKRVPVLRDGRLVGIVSRADLVRAFAQPTREVVPSRDRTPLRIAPARTTSPPPPTTPDLSAKAFQQLAAGFVAQEAAHREAARRQAEQKRREQANQMLARELTEAEWQRMLGNARTAASKGEEEHLLLQFPCELCSDRGRAVNVPDPDWPATLRGIAAEIFNRWKAELRGQGFGLNARVLSFPDGMPGDIGLFLSWSRKS